MEIILPPIPLGFLNWLPIDLNWFKILKINFTELIILIGFGYNNYNNQGDNESICLVRTRKQLPLKIRTELINFECNLANIISMRN